LSSDQHLLAAYGQMNSWALGYNLFADVWLGTVVVESESSVYAGHSNFLDKLVLTLNSSTFGMPVDNAVPTDTNIAVSSWLEFICSCCDYKSSGVIVIFAVIGIVTFVRRRRRWRRSRPRSILSTDSVDAGPQIMVTPFFDPNSFNASQDSGIWTEQQPLIIVDPEAEMVALHRLSSSPPTVLPLSRQQVAPGPVGLSDKEIARLRAEPLSNPTTSESRH